ncbi:MAG: hypothetical protein AMXMBFR47_15540 [Planctomycetota bacterium]
MRAARDLAGIARNGRGGDGLGAGEAEFAAGFGRQRIEGGAEGDDGALFQGFGAFSRPHRNTNSRRDGTRPSWFHLERSGSHRRG